jgi:hypothetical protein
VNLVWGALVVAAVTAIAVAVMLAVRRRAPEGSYFSDGDRASGVFGVLATGFSVLLGFIVFLAFTSYDQSRTGAETEALVVIQQLENAQLFPPAAGKVLTGQLLCYARNVVHEEWPRMEHGTEGDSVNPWALEMFDTVRHVQPKTASEQSAYDKWLDQTSTREEARRDRVHGAVGVIPSPLWFVLFFIAAVIFAFMLLFADPRERVVVQGMLIGSVISVMTALMLLLAALDRPFHDGVGGLKPVAMERSLRILARERAVVGDRSPLPCDARGTPVPA